jgi:DNA-binding transcriptional LysR family regulator
MAWDDLRIFLSVARAESLSGAGRGLGLDPATVGRRIQRLEEESGQLLFAKSPQGYDLTEAGTRLLPHAEAAELALAEAADAMRGEGGGLSGTIRIGAPDGCANFLLPQVCAAIQAMHPLLDIQVVALPRVVNLTKREADMAISVSAPATGRLTVRKIADYQLFLAASRRYLRNAPKITSIADLASHPVVGYIPDMITDPELDYLAEIGAPRVQFASNSVSVQFNHLVRGFGVGIVHDFAMRFGPGLRRILPETVGLTRSFWLLRPADDRKSDRLNRFADALVGALRQEMAATEMQP